MNRYIYITVAVDLGDCDELLKYLRISKFTSEMLLDYLQIVSSKFDKYFYVFYITEKLEVFSGLFYNGILLGNWILENYMDDEEFIRQTDEHMISIFQKDINKFEKIKKRLTFDMYKKYVYFSEESNKEIIKLFIKKYIDRQIEESKFNDISDYF